MFTISEYITAKRLGTRHAGRPASARTLESYTWALNKAEKLLDKPLGEFTEEDAETLLERMDEDELSTATRAQILAACRGIFSWAIANVRYEGRHPFAGIMTPIVKRELPLILSKEEIEKFLACIRSTKYRLFFSLMYYGGLRIGEVQNLRCEDIRGDALRVRGKGEKERIVPLPQGLLKKLSRFIEKRGSKEYVFEGSAWNSHEGKLTLTGARDAFKLAKECAGLPESYHPHNLRHASATHFQQAVRDITVTQKFLGHSRPETTLLYAQIADQEVYAAHKSAFGD